MATHTAKELQSCLIARGVIVNGQRRLELAELCEIARELNLQVDLDNLIEDRSNVIAQKLKDGDMSLSNPVLATGTQDLSVLPYFNFMDVFLYLLTNNSRFSLIRDYQKSEGYLLRTDGFVKHFSSCLFGFAKCMKRTLG